MAWTRARAPTESQCSGEHRGQTKNRSGAGGLDSGERDGMEPSDRVVIGSSRRGQCPGAPRPPPIATVVTTVRDAVMGGAGKLLFCCSVSSCPPTLVDGHGKHASWQATRWSVRISPWSWSVVVSLVTAVSVVTQPSSLLAVAAAGGRMKNEFCSRRMFRQGTVVEVAGVGRGRDRPGRGREAGARGSSDAAGGGRGEDEGIRVGA